MKAELIYLRFISVVIFLDVDFGHPFKIGWSINSFNKVPIYFFPFIGWAASYAQVALLMLVKVISYKSSTFPSPKIN
jgi:hypothetical protein